MSTEATVTVSLDIFDGQTHSPTYQPNPFRFPSSIQKQETVTLNAGFNALSPPSGAKAVCIIPALTAASLILKGVTGDVGIPIVPASAYHGLPAMIPLGASPSLGIANSGAASSATIVWF